jgi:single-strand DNA-binding protein
MNVVSLVGNLATDVRARKVAEDRRVATFTLAVDRLPRYEGADFLPVAVWDRLADDCAAQLAKGCCVALDGRLRSRSWEEDGRRRTVIEVVADHVQFITRASGAASRSE